MKFRVVELTYVVDRAFPLTLTAELETNVLPVTVMVVGEADPTATIDGLI